MYVSVYAAPPLLSPPTVVTFNFSVVSATPIPTPTPSVLPLVLSAAPIGPVTISLGFSNYYVVTVANPNATSGLSVQISPAVAGSFGSLMESNLPPGGLGVINGSGTVQFYQNTSAETTGVNTIYIDNPYYGGIRNNKLWNVVANAKYYFRVFVQPASPTFVYTIVAATVLPSASAVPIAATPLPAAGYAPPFLRGQTVQGTVAIGQSVCYRFIADRELGEFEMSHTIVSAGSELSIFDSWVYPARPSDILNLETTRNTICNGVPCTGTYPPGKNVTHYMSEKFFNGSSNPAWLGRAGNYFACVYNTASPSGPATFLLQLATPATPTPTPTIVPRVVTVISDVISRNNLVNSGDYGYFAVTSSEPNQPIYVGLSTADGPESFKPFTIDDTGACGGGGRGKRGVHAVVSILTLTPSSPRRGWLDFERRRRF